MKTTIIKPILFGSLLFAFACNNQRQTEDSKEIAQEANEEMIEDREMERSADLVVDLVALTRAELEMAQLAEERAEHPEVKNVASELVKEHDKMLQDLTSLAASKGITIPMEPGEDARERINKLTDEQSDNFDKEVVNELTDAHRETVDKLEKLADAEDPELQTWANNNISKVQAHLDVLKETEEDVSQTDRASRDRENEGGVRDEVAN